MTAVTFPLRPPRLAFAVCGKTDGKTMSVKITYIESLSLHTTPLYIRYFLGKFFSLEISLQDIFFSEFSHTPFEKSNVYP